MTSSTSSCSMTADEPITPITIGSSPVNIVASDSQVPTTCLGKRKPTRPPSDAWKHFEKLGDSAKCKYCGKMYACDSKKNGTSNLNKHILSKCQKYQIRGLKQSVLSFERKTDADNEGKVISMTCSEEAFQEAIAKMIIIDGLPFKHVEGEGFRKLCKLLDPRFEVPSPVKVEQNGLQIFLNEKQKLRDFFASTRQSICLSKNTWRSTLNLNYMCLTAHYIDKDWRLQKKILSFRQIVNEGYTIQKEIELCLSNWGIEKLFTVTIDDTSLSDLKIPYLLKTTNNLDGVIRRVDFMYMRCFAHILNLIVSEGLNNYHDSINRIVNVVRYVTSSPSRLQKFKTFAEIENISSNKLVLPNDTTKWSSTYLMLEAAEKFQKAFELLQSEDVEYVNKFCLSENNAAPSSADWGHARAFTKLLSVLYGTISKCSDSFSVTSNSFLHQLCSISSKLESWSENGDAFLKVMAKNMREEYDKYWGHCETININMFIALLLDPRYKEIHLKHFLEMLFGEVMAFKLANRARITLNELYNEYKLLYVETTKIQKDLDETDSVSEVDRYLMESCENLSESSFDILSWWKANSSKYKILSNIARDVLAIPVSTAPSMSAFSTCGYILDKFKSSLPPWKVEELVCTQSWLNSSIGNDLNGLTNEVEEINLDV